MRLLKLGLLFFAVSAGAWKFQMSGILSDVIFRVALLLSFIMSLYLVKFFGKKEINFIRQRISTVLQQKGILNKIQFGYRLIKLS
jgi:hypothetical protein